MPTPKPTPTPATPTREKRERAKRNPGDVPVLLETVVLTAEEADALALHNLGSIPTDRREVARHSRAQVQAVAHAAVRAQVDKCAHFLRKHIEREELRTAEQAEQAAIAKATELRAKLQRGEARATPAESTGATG